MWVGDKVVVHSPVRDAVHDGWTGTIESLKEVGGTDRCAYVRLDVPEGVVLVRPGDAVRVLSERFLTPVGDVDVQSPVS